MPAPHTATETFEIEFEPWTPQNADDLSQSDADGGIAIWDDWGVVDALCRESNEQELILNDLVRLMELSISGYIEVLEFAFDARLSNFAEIMVRQRAAQCEELRELIERERSTAYFEHELTELDNLWRVAIWNLEQDRQREFVEFTSRAEALLEDALLTAAKAFRDEEWSRRMTDLAMAIYGARSVWDDFAETATHEQSDLTAV
jgi:hypothetical protein